MTGSAVMPRHCSTVKLTPATTLLHTFSLPARARIWCILCSAPGCPSRLPAQSSTQSSRQPLLPGPVLHGQVNLKPSCCHWAGGVVGRQMAACHGGRAASLPPGACDAEALFLLGRAGRSPPFPYLKRVAAKGIPYLKKRHCQSVRQG